MENNEKKRMSFLVDEDDQNETSSAQSGKRVQQAKLKKLVIVGLMVIVFIACMYMIFGKGSKKTQENKGLNDAVPQATAPGLQADKQKAYEQEMMEQRAQEKRKALLALSDYWTNDSARSTDGSEEELEEEEEAAGEPVPNSRNQALQSYREARSTLGSFYQDGNAETQELRRQLDEVKDRLAEKEAEPATSGIDNQLALMEKSYQMAAKYLPMSTGPANQTRADTGSSSVAGTQKEIFVPVAPVKENPVSGLYREPTDSAFLAQWREMRNRSFVTVGGTPGLAQQKNSIHACVHETQTVTGESGVRLRLLEAAKTQRRIIPKGTLITADAKFQNGRLLLKVSSIELDGNIIPVEMTIYDLDGQQGLFVPYSPEMNAVTEIASNMSQSSGSSIMMTRSAGQQVAGDLSRGLVQGISGYFSKKIRTPKVTLKAGHQVLLVSKS